MKEISQNRTWAEVDLDAIAHNIGIFREKMKTGTELMGVVKADAYGHGVKEIIPTLVESGVTRLAVAMLDEALELRRNHVAIPILILGYTDPARAMEIVAYDLTQTVYSKELALALSEAGRELGREARVHIKIDTGMGRIGFTPDAGTIHMIHEIQLMPHLFIEGIFTHFACADDKDPSYTDMQFGQFMGLCSELEKAGIHIPIRHACNSAAALRFPAMHLDMVRIGILMYGMSPSAYCNAQQNGFLPAMTLKSTVILVKEMEAGRSVSYGRTFKAKERTVVATIPVGYADGYARILSNKAPVLIHGKRYPLVGNICMDMCMADVTAPYRQESEPNPVQGKRTPLSEERAVCVGDEVVLFGFQGETLLDIDEIASLRQTINYEVTCNIGRRVPRLYIKNKRLSGSSNYLLENRASD